jgi:hypothetical protein
VVAGHTWDARAAALEEFLAGLRPATARPPRVWAASGESHAFSG